MEGSDDGWSREPWNQGLTTGHRENDRQAVGKEKRHTQGSVWCLVWAEFVGSLQQDMLLRRRGELGEGGEERGGSMETSQEDKKREVRRRSPHHNIHSEPQFPYL